MLAIAAQLSIILRDLRAAVAAQTARDAMRAAVLALAWTRIGRAGTRLAALFAHWQRGTLPAPRAARPPRAIAPRQRPYFPSGRAWLAIVTNHWVRGHASQLQHLLAQPAMAEFIAAAPQAGRILRPLCHMLGAEMPPQLVLPPRTPPPRKQPVPPAVPPAPRDGKYTPAAIRRYSPGRMPSFKTRFG